jgi:hypothetical protein
MTNDTGLTASQRAQIERERQATFVRSHIQGSYQERQPARGDVYVTGSYRRQMPGWGPLVERAWDAQGPVRNLDDEEVIYPGFDPDSLEEENRLLRTEDAVVIDSMARRRR